MFKKVISHHVVVKYDIFRTKNAIEMGFTHSFQLL